MGEERGGRDRRMRGREGGREGEGRKRMREVGRDGMGE